MKSEGIEKKQLTIILAVFIISIIGLVVGIIVALASRESEKVPCEEMKDEYGMRECLSRDNPEGLGDRYDALLEKAIADENYDLFGDLVMDRSSDLSIDGKCEEALNWLDKVEKQYSASLSPIDLRGLYVSGIEVARECDDSAKEEEYQKKIDEVYQNNGGSEGVIMDDLNWDDDGNLKDDLIEGDEEE